MFIINITYKTSLEKVTKYLEAHIQFLNKQYEMKKFIASGRKVPRTGGVIIANIDTKLEVLNIIKQDPFKINDLADYELIEFIPTKTSNELAFLQQS